MVWFNKTINRCRSIKNGIFYTRHTVRTVVSIQNGHGVTSRDELHGNDANIASASTDLCVAPIPKPVYTGSRREQTDRVLVFIEEKKVSDNGFFKMRRSENRRISVTGLLPTVVVFHTAARS